MSYISEVVFVLTKEANEKFQNTIDDQVDPYKDYIRDFINKEAVNILVDEESGSVLYQFIGMSNWGVKEPTNFINDFVTRNLEDEQYHFLRLGERILDIDRYGTYFDNPFGLQLTVDYDYQGIHKL